jgi:hypothetical protein
MHLSAAMAMGHHRRANSIHNSMTFTCALAWALVLVLFPLVLIWNLTESKATKIRRARRSGFTWAAIANRYAVSPSTVRRWAHN